MYLTLKTIFDRIFKHLKVRQKDSATRCVFNFLLGAFFSFGNVARHSLSCLIYNKNYSSDSKVLYFEFDYNKRFARQFSCRGSVTNGLRGSESPRLKWSGHIYARRASLTSSKPTCLPQQIRFIEVHIQPIINVCLFVYLFIVQKICTERKLMKKKTVHFLHFVVFMTCRVVFAIRGTQKLR